MTISTEVRKAGPFEGNDSSTIFPFAFKVFKAEDMIVVRRNESTGTDTVLSLTTDYAVSLNADQNANPGGSIALVTPLAYGNTLVVSSELPFLQPTDLTNQGGFYPKVITNALDRLTIFCQQLKEGLGRALTLPITSPDGVSTELPFPTANNVIGWDESAAKLRNFSQQEIATIAAYGDTLADQFTGDGITTTFTLTKSPGGINNLDVSVGGVTMRPVYDYTWDFNTQIVFASAPPAPMVPGAKNVLVRYAQALPQQDNSFPESLASGEGFGLVGAASYAGIRNYIGALTTVRCYGRSNVFDQAEGIFVLDVADTTSADNDGTILVDIIGRRWKRVYTDQVLTTWFGSGQTATQKAINAANGDKASVLINEHQTWTGPVTVTNGVKLRGMGVDVMNGGGTKVTYTGTTDALKLVNTVNGSTSANVDIEGIWFMSSTLADNNGLIFDTASSVLKIRKCRFNGKIGVILDQTEMADIFDCSFAIGVGVQNVGVWLVNGTDKNATASTFFTNRISVKYCDFNGGTGSVCIRDDGGISHVFEDNNFNASGTHISATAVNSLRISGGEYEINSDPAIIIGLTKKNGGAGAKCNVVSIRDTYYYNDANIAFLASVAGAIGYLEVCNNHFTCPGTVFSGLAVSCDTIHAEGNRQLGAGDTGVAINNYYDDIPAATTWSAVITAPSLGNGTLAAVKSRQGKTVTLRILLQFGTTTTPGSGAWQFALPHAASTFASAFTVGSATAVIVGTAGYALAAQLTGDGLNVRVKINNATADAGAGLPAVWTTNSTLALQIAYEALAPI